MEKEQQVQELLKDKVEAEQRAKDRELQRQAKEKTELEQKAKEQEETEFQAKEKAELERRAKEQQEAERQAQEEAKRQAEEEAKRQARGEAQRQAKEKEEAARQKHEEAKRQAKEKEEATYQAEEKAELERLRARSKETLIHDIEAHRAKKAELAAKQAKLAELQKQLVVVLAETDAIMQSQQAPVMPGDTKLETQSPKASPPTPTEPLSPLETSSQDAQDAWPTRSLFQSPTPPPAQKSPATSCTATKSPSISPPPSGNLQLAIPKGQAPPPAKAPAEKASPPPSSGAITKRLMRCMEPTAKGVYKVAKCIRDQFNAGGTSKEKVLKLFAACDNKPDSPPKPYISHAP